MSPTSDSILARRNGPTVKSPIRLPISASSHLFFLKANTPPSNVNTDSIIPTAEHIRKMDPSCSIVIGSSVPCGINCVGSISIEDTHESNPSRPATINIKPAIVGIELPVGCRVNESYSVGCTDVSFTSVS